MKKLVLETANVKNNIAKIKAASTAPRIIGVVKGNGYGFGTVKFANLIKGMGVSLIAVSLLSEAEELRAAGFQDEILLLSPTEVEENAEKIVNLGITAAVGSIESALVLDKAAKAAGKTVNCHIAFDTGMGRFGFDYANAADALRTIKQFDSLKIEGVFSHLSSSFLREKKFTVVQKQRFDAVVEAVAEAKLKPRYIHLANSCALFNFPETHYTAVRVGSALVGRLPKGVGKGLVPCGFLECTVDAPRYLAKGHNVGYANTYKTRHITHIAVADVGYADGFALRKSVDTYRLRDRLREVKAALFPRRIKIKIGDTPVRVLGRVGMVNCVVDVSDVKAFRAGMTAVVDINPIYVNPNIEREYR